MAQLHEVLSTILIDITKAQHAANVFSCQLSKRYKDDKLLKSFPIPNALISNIDINLKYGLAKDLEFPHETPVTEVNLDNFYPSTNKFLKIGHICAANVLDGVIELLKSKNLPDLPSEQGKREKILESLQSEKIRVDLGNAIGNSLDNWYRFLRAANEKEISKEEQINKAIAKVKQSISEILLSDIDLKQQFLPGDLAGVLENYQSNFWQKLEANIKPLIAELFLEEESVIHKSMDVFVDADKLKNLPESAIQSMNFQIQLQNYKCVVTKPGEEEELIPED
jgi:hypothetical protein